MTLSTSKFDRIIKDVVGSLVDIAMKTENNESKVISPGLKDRWTTMQKVASTLAVMSIEENLRKGRTLRFLSDGIDFTISREDLEEGYKNGS